MEVEEPTPTGATVVGEEPAGAETVITAGALIGA